MFAYCGNNPVNRTDAAGQAWWHWAVAAAIVVAAAAAVVVTAGGATAAIVAVTCVANGVAASTTAATVAAGVFIGSSTALAASAYSAAIESNSAEEFAAHGEYALYSTAISGAIGGAAAYGMDRAQNKPQNSPLNTSECFVAGTMILVAEGAKAIETVEAGDYVWAWDEETGNVALKEVVETYVNETTTLVHGNNHLLGWEGRSRRCPLPSRFLPGSRCSHLRYLPCRQIPMRSAADRSDCCILRDTTDSCRSRCRARRF